MAAMLDGRNNRFFFPWEQMFFLMQIIFIVLPSNMAAVQNFYYCCLPREEQYLKAEVNFVQKMKKREKLFFLSQH